MSQFAYVIQPTDPCIFVEIYLPKKAELQGSLYETLTQGFKKQVVMDHFLNPDEAQKKAILKMLGKGWTSFPTGYPNQDEITAFPRLFFGYSTYEVDGVFLAQNPAKPEMDDDDKWYSIAEERTQIIRLVFRYDVSDRPLAEIDFIKAALHDPFSEIGPFQENHPYVKEQIEHFKKLDIDIDGTLAKLDKWISYVGLFLFGYLLFNVCHRIESLNVSDDEQLDSEDIKQDEIWVSSFWNLNMNIIKWTKI